MQTYLTYLPSTKSYAVWRNGALWHSTKDPVAALVWLRKACER